ncbi:hypothetical protein LXL04_030582 [Taraxacum kok-saghyz]
MSNQENYQQFGQRLPPPPSSLQQDPQAYLIPQHSYLNAPAPPPRIPPPNPQGHHFYRVPPPPPNSSYFTPTPFGSVHLPPPPPPPSSPPPGPPPLPPSPHESLPTDPELSPSSRKPSVADMSNDILNSIAGSENSNIPPPKPTDEKTVRKIELLCQYIAKNGNEFEYMTCQKEVDNPEFAFLFGGPPGSEAAISHEYFKWMKKKFSSNESLHEKHSNDISHSHSPSGSGSDMDMEDDITQLYGHDEPDFTSNQLDIKVEEEHASHISHKDVTESRVPGELTEEGTNPIRLIQGYASDNTSENDNELHFENVSPVSGSPFIKQDTFNPSDPKTKIPEPSTTTEDNAKQDDNNDKLKVDEFGRLVKTGGVSDSDSGDYRSRRGKRGGRNRSRSRSRSRSPIGRRRREKRSRSRSWSPKKRRRSRSPYRKRGEETGADWTNRRNKSHYCGPTRQSEKNDEFRRDNNNHRYTQDVSDTSVKHEFVDPCEEVNSVSLPQQTEQLVTESVTPPQLPNYPMLPVPPSSTWNPLPLPPPPPRPQYNQNQPTLPLTYPFFKPYPPELTPLQQPYYGQSRIIPHYNPYASTFDQPLSTGTSFNYSNQSQSQSQNQNQYDPLFDSIEPPLEGTAKQEGAEVAEADEFGETGDAEVENESPSSTDVATGEVEIDQVKKKSENNKESRSMKLFKVSLAEFVKDVLKPSWKQGNMSKEAFKTIVKKTVDKVSGAIKKHQVPKSQAKINQYIDSSQRKLTKLVMGYVDKYVKV